ncbi:MAG: DUF3943 domain-containing protein, partial [Spirochaetia bacterium]|nr:DUF3943 domain-containing protein [Spirochaetia bacterium]
ESAESAAPPPAENQDETPPEEYGRDFPMALAQGMAANLSIWGYDYIIMQPYARVSPTTWKNNLKEGAEWDNSDFFTNQILHPYHGGMYYTGARAYGFSYWESIVFAGFGSFVWEYFAERDTPATNDLIITTMGGAAFGEAGYRLAVAFSNSNDTGARKFLREFAAWVVNPMYKINETVFGEPFTERNRLPRTPVDITLRAGANYTHDDDGRFSGYPHAYIGVNIAYGDPWAGGDFYAPYDFFQVKTDGEPDWANPSGDIFADAILCGFKLYPGDDARMLLGLYQQFDYLENLVYKFAANGAGAGLQMLVPFDGLGALEFKGQLYGVVLGIMDSRYSHWEINNYDTKDTGWAYKLGLSYACDYFSLSLHYMYYWLRVLDGSGWTDTVDIFTSTLEAPLAQDTGLGLELRYYNRWASDGYDSAWAWSLKAFLAYKF